MLAHDETLNRKPTSPSLLSRIDFFVIYQRLGRIRYLGLISFWLTMFILSGFISLLFPKPDEMETISTFSKLLRCSSIIIPATMIFPNLILVQKRRFNDFNCSGWWMLLNIIPGIGFIVFLCLSLKSGSSGVNKFGDITKCPTKFDYGLLFLFPLLMALIIFFDIDISSFHMT